MKVNDNDIIAKSSEIHISVTIGYLKNFDSYRIFDASFHKLSMTLKSFLSLDKNGMEYDLTK